MRRARTNHLAGRERGTAHSQDVATAARAPWTASCLYRMLCCPLCAHQNEGQKLPRVRTFYGAACSGCRYTAGSSRGELHREDTDLPVSPSASALYHSNIQAKSSEVGVLAGPKKPVSCLGPHGDSGGNSFYYFRLVEVYSAVSLVVPVSRTAALGAS